MAQAGRRGVAFAHARGDMEAPAQSPLRGRVVLSQGCCVVLLLHQHHCTPWSCSLYHGAGEITLFDCPNGRRAPNRSLPRSGAAKFIVLQAFLFGRSLPARQSAANYQVQVSSSISLALTHRKPPPKNLTHPTYSSTLTRHSLHTHTLSSCPLTAYYSHHAKHTKHTISIDHAPLSPS